MIMTNTKQCEKCVYGEHWSRVGWVCVRAFDAMRDRVYQDRIPNRTENKCFDYEKRGKKKMNAIIVEKKEENTAAPVVENAVDTEVYKAVGTGFISVDGSMKIFYGEIEIRIKPIQPTGITGSVEEE